MASISFVEGKWRALIRRKGYKSISKRFATKAKALAWARLHARQQAGGGLAVAGSGHGVIVSGLVLFLG